MDSIVTLKKALVLSSKDTSSSFHADIGENSLKTEFPLDKENASHEDLKIEMLQNARLMDKARFLQMSALILQQFFSSCHDKLKQDDNCDVTLRTEFVRKESLEVFYFY